MIDVLRAKLSDWREDLDEAYTVFNNRLFKEGVLIPQRRLLHQMWRTKGNTLTVILDAARHEVTGMVINALEHHTDLDEYNVRYVWSPATNTFDWARRVFGKGRWEISYFSGATPINTVSYDWSQHKDLLALYGGFRPVEHIAWIDNVWDSCYDPEYYTTDPSCMAKTVAAKLRVQHSLFGDVGHVVAHFFQPHMPPARGAWLPPEYVPPKRIRKKEGRPPADPPDAPFWTQVYQGRIPPNHAVRAYFSNARVGIRNGLIPLLKDVAHYFDRIVITADHGNCLGEYGVWGHPPRVRDELWASLRLVPWVEVFV